MITRSITILCLLTSLGFSQQDNELAYEEKGFLTELFSKSDTRITEDIYVNINVFTALTLVDERFQKESNNQVTAPITPLLTFSYKF